MTEHDKAQQARKGLIDAVKGKAKEVFGALTGNDALVAEGQLDQTQAEKRREANALEAAADSEAAQASAQAAQARAEGLQQRTEMDAEATAMKRAVRDEQAEAKHTAERSAQLDAARAETRAELHAQDEARRAKATEREEISEAQAEIVEAAAAHQSSGQVSTNTHAEAEGIRREAADLTDEAGLP